MTYLWSEWPGISEQTRRELERLDVQTTDDLLGRCRTADSRRELSEELGVPAEKVARLASEADLIRVPGVGPLFARLLAECGVRCLQDLRHWSAENLLSELSDVNEDLAIVRGLPSLRLVERWVLESRALSTTLHNVRNEEFVPVSPPF